MVSSATILRSEQRGRMKGFNGDQMGCWMDSGAGCQEQKPSTVWKWEEPSRNAYSQTAAKASLVGRPTGLTMPRNFPKQGGTSTADQAKVQAEKQQEAQWLG